MLRRILPHPQPFPRRGRESPLPAGREAARVRARKVGNRNLRDIRDSKDRLGAATPTDNKVCIVERLTQSHILDASIDD